MPQLWLNMLMPKINGTQHLACSLTVRSLFRSHSLVMGASLEGPEVRDHLGVFCI